MKQQLTSVLCILAIVALELQSCAVRDFRANYAEANRLIHKTENLKAKPFLKIHLRNGDVFIVTDDWIIDTVENQVVGTGKYYGLNRKVMEEGTRHIPLEQVALFETNQEIRGVKAAQYTFVVLGVVNASVLAICALNPKACYGSCPTFYIDEHSSLQSADAEGFSNAISPALEYHDIDALINAPLDAGEFSITMKNEALETHCVKAVKLLAYPREGGERVYHTPDDAFYRCQGHYPLTAATAAEGDITALLQNEDRQERFSYADRRNMASLEEIYLSFDGVPSANPLGLSLSFRQTLMTTYLIYSAMGYMGDQVSDYFMQIETGSAEMRDKLNRGMKDALGNIDVYQWDETKGAWVFQQAFYETGPIARNKQLIPLQAAANGSGIQLKLVLNKGLWRLDYAALTSIVEAVQPLEIEPTSIINQGKPDEVALREINDPKAYLISMPGSKYRFNFTLPAAGQDYELFLFSKGYYLEWMREEWLREKNLFKLRQMVEKPRKYLRQEARNYKEYEKTMETQFWNSKIATKNHTYHED